MVKKTMICECFGHYLNLYNLTDLIASELVRRVNEYFRRKQKRISNIYRRIKRIQYHRSYSILSHESLRVFYRGATQLIDHYLFNRKQFVSIGKHNSQVHSQKVHINVKCGG